MNFIIPFMRRIFMLLSLKFPFFWESFAILTVLRIRSIRPGKVRLWTRSASVLDGLSFTVVRGAVSTDLAFLRVTRGLLVSVFSFFPGNI